MVKIRQFSTLNQEDFEAWLSDTDNFTALLASEAEVIDSAKRKAGRYGIAWPEAQAPEFRPVESAPEPKAEPVPVNKPERFVCNHSPGYKILLGEKMLEFQGGVFVSEDSDEIYAIMRDPWFGIHITPDNRALLEVKQWLK